jgi:L-iditol 2-dehydrogenase
MKLLTCRATALVKISDVSLPVLAEGDILIEMLACGVCGTDLMKVYDASVPKPVQLGHEIVGRVVVGNPQFPIGQRVAVAHHAPDLNSHYSKRGSATQDPVFKSSNVFPGGFAEFIRVPRDLVGQTVFAVPDEMSTARAAFMEPLACCIRALDRVPVQPDDTVLLIGAGAIGLLFLPLVHERGGRMVVADVREERLQAAQEWHAAATCMVGRDDIGATSKSLNEGRGVDVVILTVVNQATLELALASVRDGGWIIPFGVKPGMMPTVDLWQMYRREVSLVTSYSATPDGLERALKLLSKPGFELEKTISHQLPLADAAHGFTLLHEAKASKVLVIGAT